jgi:hypothetical protein
VKAWLYYRAPPLPLIKRPFSTERTMTETLIAIVTSILLTFAPWHGTKEDPAAREERSRMLASSMVLMVDYASCSNDYDGDPECQRVIKPELRLPLLARLIAVGKFESAYALHIHEGRCRTHIGECDGGRARSPWQFQAVPAVYGVRIKDFWHAYRGADQQSTDGAAYAAALILARSYENCRTWEGAIGQYATGNACRWAYAPARETLALRLERELRELLAEEDEDEDGDEDGEEADDGD